MRKQVGIAVIILASLLIVYTAGRSLWNLTRNDESSAGVKTALGATNAALNSNDVRIDAWVDDRRVAPLQIKPPITFWITVHNPATEATKDITNVRVLMMRLPNFQPAGGAWKPGSDGLPVPAQTAPLLKPGQAMTVERQLTVLERRGKFGISAVIGWTDAAGAERRKGITLSPIVVGDTEQERLLRFLRGVVNFLKDFALPLALLFLGVRIKRVEEHNALLQQTWNLMLPKMHENAEKYYIPLMSHADSILRYVKKGDLAYAFFFYAKFLAVMKRMVYKIGGFYLKSQAGEDVVSRLWERMLHEADSAVWYGRLKRERLQLDTDPGKTYYEFQQRQPLHVAQASALFVSAAGQKEFKRQLPLFQLFSMALYFEANWTYIAWYGAPPEFPKQAFDKAIGDLAVANPPSEYQELLAVLRDYSKKAGRRQL